MIKINKKMTAFIVSLGLATSPYVLSSCSSSGSTVNELITNDIIGSELIEDIRLVA